MFFKKDPPNNAKLLVKLKQFDRIKSGLIYQ